MKSRKQFIELLDFIAKYSNFVEGIAFPHTDLDKFAGLMFKNEKAYFIVCFRPAINSSTYLTCFDQMVYIGIFLFKTTYSSELEDSYLNCFQNLTLSDVQRIIAYEPEVIEPDKKAKNFILFLKKNRH